MTLFLYNYIFVIDIFIYKYYNITNIIVFSYSIKNNKCHLLVYTLIVIKVVNATQLVCKPTHCIFIFLINSYNPSIAICWKGCDYAVGRVN